MNEKCDTAGCGRYARKASESGRSVRCAMHATSIHTVEVKPDFTPAPSFDEICGVAVEDGVTLAPPIPCEGEDFEGECPCASCTADRARWTAFHAAPLQEVPRIPYGVRHCPCGGYIKASSARCSHCSAREA
jgi:hypothetical protein